MTASDLDTLPPLREVIAQHALMAKKSLGQHFLLDLNLTRRIVAAAGDLRNCTVFEIGPGPGGLTRSLVGGTTAKVIAIEKDPRFVAALGDLVALADGRLKVIEGDALQIDPAALAHGDWAVVANLPYNVGTPLLLGWLKQGGFRSLTLMLQAEVVDRLVAEPGTKAYGRLSVITQFCCNAKRAMTIPARAFTPPPKIDSAVVHLTPRADRPADVDFEALEKITAAAFGQRRKMLRSSLKPLGGEHLLEAAGIMPEKRAEELAVVDFENLARCLKTRAI